MTAENKITPSEGVTPHIEEAVAASFSDMTVGVTRPLDQTLTVPERKQQGANVIDGIKEYLAKPRILQDVQWTPALGDETPLWTCDFPDFQGTIAPPTPAPAPIPMIDSFLGKLRGFTGMRYTVNLKVVLNATPFQRGKLRLVYMPNGQQVPSRFVQHTANKISVSQLPGAEMTTLDESMEISIPFTSYEEYYDFNTQRKTPRVQLRVFSPLVNGPNATSLNANVTTWVWYTDVELYGATASVVPQSSGIQRITKRGKAVSEQEDRPLSSWLEASSRLASSMNGIPMVSSITTPTAVFLKYASGVANAFGYSRPVQGKPVEAIAPHYMNNLPNADGVNVGSVLAINKDAKLRTINDYSPEGKDEMSINFIKRQWSYLTEFQLTTSNTLGQEVFARDLSAVMGGSGNFFGTSVVPTEFLARLFRYYRGSMEICFKFVKTGFHAGTLQISYEVGSNPLVPNLNIDLTAPLHRSTIDLQAGDQACFNFPFISNRDWHINGAKYGTLRVHVLNPLVAPETVSNSIVVQVYTRGGDDMEFAGLRQLLSNPQVPDPIVAQGGGVEATGDIVCEVIGGIMAPQKITGSQMMDAQSESVTSLLQVLKSGQKFTLRAPTAVPDNVNVTRFNPGAWHVYTFNPTNGVLVGRTAVQANTLNLIRACYAYQRGGYEISITPAVLNSERGNLTVALDDDSNDIYTPGLSNLDDFNVVGDDTVFSRRTRNFRASGSGQHGLSYVVPYRSAYRVSLITPYTQIGTPNQSVTPSRREFTESSCVLFAYQSTNNAFLRVAEDYQLMQWLGVPPIRLD